MPDRRVRTDALVPRQRIAELELDGALGDPSEQVERQGARLAEAMLGASGLIMLVTIGFLGVPDRQRLLTILVGAALLAVALGSAALRIEQRSRALLRMLPLCLVLGLLAEGLGTGKVSVPYAGLLTLAFVWVGLQERRGASFVLVPFAALAWVACQGGFSSTTGVRLPIAIGVWLLVGELLAARTQRTRQLAGQLAHAASTDPLTGLANRRELDRLLDSIETGDALVLLDVDHFKAVNDELGHEAGDQLLVSLARAIATELGPLDKAARVGGDELVLVLRPGNAPRAAKLVESIARRWSEASGGALRSFSAGLAVHSAGSHAATLQRADEALYRAKATLRGGMVLAGGDGVQPNV